MLMWRNTHAHIGRINKQISGRSKSDGFRADKEQAQNLIHAHANLFPTRRILSGLQLRFALLRPKHVVPM